MKLDRRTWALSAGVAVAAAAAGAGGSLWRNRNASAAEGQLWASSFQTPAGTPLVMATFRGRPLLLNFWATWCPPCVREMPAIDRFAREVAGRGWNVVGLAADNLEPVRDFLALRPVSYAIGLTGFAGIELSKTLGNSAGGLPFTLLLGRDGSVLQRRSGEIDGAQLSAWAAAVDAG